MMYILSVQAKSQWKLSANSLRLSRQHTFEMETFIDKHHCIIGLLKNFMHWDVNQTSYVLHLDISECSPWSGCGESNRTDPQPHSQQLHHTGGSCWWPAPLTQVQNDQGKPLCHHSTGSVLPPHFPWFSEGLKSLSKIFYKKFSDALQQHHVCKIWST